MEAVPRLPMISFETKTSTEPVSFGIKLKHYISTFYNEDADSYNNEIHSLETLRSGAVRAPIDISGCQMLKKYYCQLHFLKSRFPMEDGQACAIHFSWRDNYSNMVCSLADVDFELMNILFDIGAVHSKLGALDSRVTPEGMKMACTHFQCAAWAFQTVREVYPQMVSLVLAPEVIHFMHLTCLAQAQECILEKSMMDNRKATIIAKVAVQVAEYYKQSLNTLQTNEEGSFSDLIGSRTYKDWVKYLNFKILYHKAIALLYLGQQAEEQQKMGERVAFYQAACDTLQEAAKRSSKLSNQQEISEALGFTSDVIEGKKKAAKNENEFIYHEEVPDKEALPEIKGASLVKGIPFTVNDLDVSGPDIFARLIPMEAHEASSLYSEKKANLLRTLAEAIEEKDNALAKFMSSLKLDVLSQMKHATGLPDDVIDRAAAMSVKHSAIQDLVNAMAKLSNIYHDVESMLTEIGGLIKEEEQKEKDYQSQMGARPPSIIATDLTREYTKYQEAHSKACESNQNLHKVMTTNSTYLKILCQPLVEIKKQIPSLELPNPNVNDHILMEVEKLLAKVDEMKKQRAMLWTQFHEAVKNDDITSRLVTRTPQMSKEQLFEQELEKHRKQAILIEQNMAAQDNILKAMVNVYASFTDTRRYLQDVIGKRNHMLTQINNSYDTYDDLLAKANKGIDFYNKLETNVSKLLQRIKSTCKVQEEEREHILAKQTKSVISSSSGGPKLKDYLDAKAKDYLDTKMAEGMIQPPLDSSYSAVATGGILSNVTDQAWPPGIRPTPVGSEMKNENVSSYGTEHNYPIYDHVGNTNLYYNPAYATANATVPNTTTTYSNNPEYNYTVYDSKTIDKDLSARMAGLMSNKASSIESLDSSNNSQQPVAPYPFTATNSQIPPKETILAAPPNSADNLNAALGYSANINPSIYSHYVSGEVPNSISGHLHMDVKQNPTTIIPSAQLPDYHNYAASNASSMYPPSSALASYVLPNSYNTMASLPNPIQAGTSYNTQFSITPTTYNEGSVYMQPGSIPNSFAPSLSSYNTILSVPNTQSQESIKDPNDLNQSTYINTNVSNPNMQPYSTSNYAGYYTNYQQYDTQVDVSSPFLYNTVSTYQTPNLQGEEQLQNYIGDSSSTVIHQSISNSSLTPAYMNYSSSSPNVSNYQTPSLSTTDNALTPVVQQSSVDTKKEKSNIDLLSGLDFTINQAPLIPQPKKIETAPNEVSVAKSMDQRVCSTSANKMNDEPILVKAPVLKKYFQRNSFDDPTLLREFEQEVDKFEKFVDTLSSKTLNGPTSLELKWKEIQDKQDGEQCSRSISIARCYPMKNRFPDILPYDQTRVKLAVKKDDYINASYIKDISLYTPDFIVTQSPLYTTYNDFWTMVCDEKVDLILCLLNDSEIGHDKYWPTKEPIKIGNFSIAIEETEIHQYWTKTELSVSQLDLRTKRKILHVHFSSWPTTLFPRVMTVVNFINDILNYQKFIAPVVIHCSAGIGRSGLMCLLLSAAAEVTTNPPAIPDLSNLAMKLCSARKNIIRDREHFKFAYQVFLQFVKEIVHAKKSTKNHIGDSTSHQSQALPNLNAIEEDPLNLLDPFWANKK